MNKKTKYLLTGALLFSVFSMNLNAATIKETTIDGDGYDTINSNNTIIGITKFDGTAVITGARVAKATTNDSKYYIEENNSLDNYESPTIYIYMGIGGWYSLDDNNQASPITDSETLNKLENSKIYYVNNIEKKLEVDVTGYDINEKSLPNGVTKDNNKLIVNATIREFKVETTDGIELKFKINEGNFILDESEFYTLDREGFITKYNGPKGNIEIDSKINDVEVKGIRSGAFSGKEITSVVIPESITNIESNAFDDSALTKVVVNEKYDSSDFDSLASDAFGSFTNITYNNDLTRLLNSYKNELNLKVQKDFNLDDEQTRKIAISYFAEKIEDERINYQEGTTIFRSFLYKDDSTLTIKVWKYNNNRGIDKEVSKDITYTIEKVDGNNSDIENINKAKADYDEYRNKVNNNFKSDTSLELLTSNKIYEIYGLYNVNCLITDVGDGEPTEDEGININELGFDYIIFANDILYSVDNLYTQNYVIYNIKNLENTADNDDLYVKSVLEHFKEQTNITEYEIVKINEKEYSVFKNGGLITYYIVLKDSRNNNIWDVWVRNDDISSVYTVDESGFITSYSGVGGDISIPSKINYVNIVGIKSGAFSGKEITSVVIPESITNIESNAFDDSALTKVVVNEKYDSSDFKSLASDAFGSFTNITYNNDLTRALNDFNDELTLKVQKDYTIEDNDLYKDAISYLAALTELSRINNDKYIMQVDTGDGDSEGDLEEIADSLVVRYSKETSDNKLKLTISKNLTTRYVEVNKEVSYAVNKVDGDATTLENINKAVNEYKTKVSTFKTNFKNDTSLEDPTTDKKIYSLLSSYNLSFKNIAFGGGTSGEEEGINFEDYILDYAICKDNILYSIEGFESLGLVYNSKLNLKDYDNEEVFVNKVLENFVNNTGVTTYTITYKYSSTSISTKEIIKSISLIDSRNNNSWTIINSSSADEQISKQNQGSVNVTSYFPSLSYEDYDNTKEWVGKALEKYKEKSGADSYSTYFFELVTDFNGKNIEYKKDKDGNYTYIYKVTVDNGTHAGTMEDPIERWEIYLYKTTSEKIEFEDYEASTTTGSITNAIEELSTKKSITNYSSSFSSRFYIKNNETGKFEVSNDYNDATHYRTLVYDYDNDKVYRLYYKLNK